jgi:hypothetical protein
LSHEKSVSHPVSFHERGTLRDQSESLSLVTMVEQKVPLFGRLLLKQQQQQQQTYYKRW